MKLAWLAIAATLLAAPASAQTPPIPDLKGTWKGESESIVFGSGNTHHTPATPPKEPQLRSVPFTFVIDKQDGRRFSGTFSSAKANETVVGVVSRSGAIYMVDDDGYSVGTVLAPNRVEFCYLHLAADSRIASCTEMLKQ